MTIFFNSKFDSIITNKLSVLEIIIIVIGTVITFEHEIKWKNKGY